jgi:hypothetical protein
MPFGPENSVRRRLAGIPPLRRAVRTVRRSAEIERLQAQLGVDPSLGRLTGDAAPILRFLQWAPPGHFYSPVPDFRDIAADRERIFAYPDALPNVDLNAEGQLRLFGQLSDLVRGTAFPEEPDPAWRFYLNNPSYCIGDSLMLSGMLRHLRPARYLEVGSGWSTALALDVSERYLDGRMDVTCIEPYPDALRRLLRPSDHIKVFAESVQNVPLELFAALEPRDVLFIDCSHVVKTGSDAHYLITRVLPILGPDVYVHIHDIFYPFEYPESWVEEGRAWSEAYLLHAFLLFNKSFQIALFNDWMITKNRQIVADRLPEMLPAAGGAIWLRRCPG